MKTDIIRIKTADDDINLMIIFYKGNADVY